MLPVSQIRESGSRSKGKHNKILEKGNDVREIQRMDGELKGWERGRSYKGERMGGKQ